MGVDGKLFFAPQKTAVPHCRRDLCSANVRQGHRSTAKREPPGGLQAATARPFTGAQGFAFRYGSRYPY